jgi:hypothetical protein
MVYPYMGLESSAAIALDGSSLKAGTMRFIRPQIIDSLREAFMRLIKSRCLGIRSGQFLDEPHVVLWNFLKHRD